ncbi:hypothetical protein PG985_003202 [Apiospora marii]|uniref:uncharacterized protein n=1 Tax=Apiospora marii TaxID=335849 RepID=UPI0031322BA7
MESIAQSASPSSVPAKRVNSDTGHRDSKKTRRVIDNRPVLLFPRISGLKSHFECYAFIVPTVAMGSSGAFYLRGVGATPAWTPLFVSYSYPTLQAKPLQPAPSAALEECDALWKDHLARSVLSW